MGLYQECWKLTLGGVALQLCGCVLIQDYLPQGMGQAFMFFPLMSKQNLQLSGDLCGWRQKGTVPTSE